MNQLFLICVFSQRLMIATDSLGRESEITNVLLNYNLPAGSIEPYIIFQFLPIREDLDVKNKTEIDMFSI